MFISSLWPEKDWFEFLLGIYSNMLWLKTMLLWGFFYDTTCWIYVLSNKHGVGKHNKWGVWTNNKTRFCFWRKKHLFITTSACFMSNCLYITYGVHTNSFCFPPMLPFLHYYPSTTIYRWHQIALITYKSINYILNTSKSVKMLISVKSGRLLQIPTPLLRHASWEGGMLGMFCVVRDIS